MKQKQAVQVRLDDERLAFVQQQAEESERTVSQYLRWLIRKEQIRVMGTT